MLRLADAWTWDFWLADDGRSYHLYILKAPRHIGHPDNVHGSLWILTQRLLEAGILGPQSAQAIVSSAQVKPPCAHAQGVSCFEILVLGFVGVLLNERVRVLGETTGRSDKQPRVMRTFGQQTLDQL